MLFRNKIFHITFFGGSEMQKSTFLKKNVPTAAFHTGLVD